METEQLIQLIKTVSASNLTEFCYEEDDKRIILKKETQVQVQAPVVTVPVNTVAAVPSNTVEQTAAPQTEAVEMSGNIVKSPLVGTFYSAPAEDAAPYVQVGDIVRKGQTIAIVEAMKLMNEIESEFDGEIKEIFVENGQTVEYGQPLFCIG